MPKPGQFLAFLLLGAVLMGCTALNPSLSGTGGYRVERIITDNSLPEETGKIIGVVKDAQTGERLAKGKVFVYTIDQQYALNADGSFSEEIPAGKYVIAFESEGYSSITTANVLIRTKTSTFLNVQLRPARAGSNPSKTTN